MSNITEGSSFMFRSLLSSRKNLRTEELSAEYSSIRSFLRKRDCILTGPFITQMNLGTVVGDTVVCDFEILVPIPSDITVSAPFFFVPQLRIGNCVSLKYDGPFDELSAQYAKLYEYIRDHSLEPMTGMYHIYELGNAESQYIILCIGTRKARFASI